MSDSTPTVFITKCPIVYPLRGKFMARLEDGRYRVFSRKRKAIKWAMKRALADYVAVYRNQGYMIYSEKPFLFLGAKTDYGGLHS